MAVCALTMNQSTGMLEHLDVDMSISTIGNESLGFEEKKSETIEDDGMKLADWRWATEKGYWDPKSRCWNESLGGMSAYISRRNERRAEIVQRQQRASA